MLETDEQPVVRAVNEMGKVELNHRSSAGDPAARYRYAIAQVMPSCSVVAFGAASGTRRMWLSTSRAEQE